MRKVRVTCLIYFHVLVVPSLSLARITGSSLNWLGRRENSERVSEFSLVFNSDIPTDL